MMKSRFSISISSVDLALMWDYHLNDNFKRLSGHLGFMYKDNTDLQKQINTLHNRIIDLETMLIAGKK